MIVVVVTLVTQIRDLYKFKAIIMGYFVEVSFDNRGVYANAENPDFAA